MAEFQPSGRPPWWRRHWLALTALGVIVPLTYAVLAATVLPGWVVSLTGSKADENHRLDAIANARGALLGVLAPLVVAIGAVAAFLNYRETAAQNRRTVELSRDTLDVTERGQLTERFTKAIEQLGDSRLDIRLGGIYALEQIAKESKELHRPVMEILTAFLREHSQKPREASDTLAQEEAAASMQSDAASDEHAGPLRADFQAIATVLGRREVSHDPDGFRLDLRGVALSMVDFADAQRFQSANFHGAQLRGARFVRAQLEGASFLDALLKEANFAGALLEGANFEGAQLQEADLRHAQLQTANFANAQLQNASFNGAQLQNASFWRADLEGAKFRLGQTDGLDARGLTPEQFDLALNVNKAMLPRYLIRALESKGVVRPAD